MICLKCGNNNPINLKYCQKCGAFLKKIGVFDEPTYGHLNIVSEDGKETSALGYAECVPCKELREACESLLSNNITLKDFEDVISKYFEYLPRRIKDIKGLIETNEAQGVPETIQMYEFMLFSYNLMLEALNKMQNYLADQNLKYIKESLKIIREANDQMAKAKEIGLKLEDSLKSRKKEE